jgi:ubiquinone/menaquinone biosynthesis C-methylase UbiE
MFLMEFIHVGIHHSPNTPKAIDEIYRVLKPGGFSKIMIYHKHILV